MKDAPFRLKRLFLHRMESHSGIGHPSADRRTHPNTPRSRTTQVNGRQPGVCAPRGRSSPPRDGQVPLQVADGPLGTSGAPRASAPRRQHCRRAQRDRQHGGQHQYVPSSWRIFYYRSIVVFYIKNFVNMVGVWCLRSRLKGGGFF